MIAEIAHGLAWLACACALLQLFAAWRLPALAGPAALAVGWLWLWIAGGLAWLFWSLDFSVVAVAANTQSALPEGLRLAAAVLRPGGGWPVAAALVAWGGAVVAWRGAPRAVLGGVAVASVALHIGLLAGHNPFVRADPAPVEGAGFSPVWRDRLANFGPTHPALSAVLAVGGRGGMATLVDVAPVGGPDSTGVVGEIRLGLNAPLVLRPEWRETNLPRHASSVPDTAWADGGWWRASIRPHGDGRWLVTVARLRFDPWLLGLAVVGLAGFTWLQRRRRA